jgi:glutaminyl-peptide cyclotransferase
MAEANIVRWIIVALIVCAGCRPTQPPPSLNVEEFQGDRAFQHVKRVVEFGPRHPGSEPLRQAAAYIVQQLRAAGWDAEEQVFRASTPRGPMEFRNVVGRSRAKRIGNRAGILIIGTHYDTKFIDTGKFVGANDGGSGVGALLEIARVAKDQPDVWLVFFDGEECMVEYGPEDGLWGSRYFVEDLKGRGLVKSIEGLVLLDMIGDRDLNITLPRNGTPSLSQRVFDAARAVGYRDYFGFWPGDILDDHVPFLMAGIPAVNLIDFQMGSAPGLNDYWHTDEDTLDKVSPKSLEIVGRVVLQMLALREPVR